MREMGRSIKIVRPVAPNTTVMVGVRMPSDLRARLEQSALEGDRNLSQEVVRRLRKSFESAPVVNLRAVNERGD